MSQFNPTYTFKAEIADMCETHCGKSIEQVERLKRKYEKKNWKTSYKVENNSNIGNSRLNGK